MTPTNWRAMSDGLALALRMHCRCQKNLDLKVVHQCSPCKRLAEYDLAVANEAIVQTPMVAAKAALRAVADLAGERHD